MTIANTSIEKFDQDVLEASKQFPVLVDFWAEWCAPCLVIAPVLEKVIGDLAGTVTLVKLEVDAGENMKLAGRYHVRGFPTVILFQEAEEVARFSGALSSMQIKAFLNQHLESTDPASRQAQ
jgi:putative thioredoxin